MTLFYLSGPRNWKQPRKIQRPRPRQFNNIPLHIRPMRSIQILRSHPITTQHIHPRPPFTLTQSETGGNPIYISCNLTKDQMLCSGWSQSFSRAEHLFSNTQQPRNTIVSDVSGRAKWQEAGRGFWRVLLNGRGWLFMDGERRGFCWRRCLNRPHKFRPFLH